jgi:hypothetical protein
MRAPFQLACSIKSFVVSLSLDRGAAHAPAAQGQGQHPAFATAFPPPSLPRSTGLRRRWLVALALPVVVAAAPRAWGQEAAPAAAPACPLPAEIAVTFLDSKCTKVVLSEPQTFVRYYHADTNKKGRYLTTDRLATNVEVIRRLALNQAWGNRAERMVMVTVPAGTVVYQGVVAPQAPVACYPGGGQQTFIENTRDPALVWADGPALTLQPFSCP